MRKIGKQVFLKSWMCKLTQMILNSSEFCFIYIPRKIFEPKRKKIYQKHESVYDTVDWTPNTCH